MKRREFIVLVCGAAVAWPTIARAQQSNVRRIGMLMPVSASAAAANIEAFRQGLRERGYVEGQNILIEPRYAEAQRDPLPALAVELVRRRVDVIVTWGTPAAQEAKRATSTIPIVMAAATDPVGSGLIANLARPGGNVTGVTSGSWDLSKKSLELLKELVPRVTRVAVLVDLAGPNAPLFRPAIESAARSLNLQLHFVNTRTHKEWEPLKRELEQAFASMAPDRAEALFVLHHVSLFQHRKRFVDFLVKSRLPAMYERREYVEAGGLMSYGVDFQNNFRHAAAFVDKILKGAKPADLPVEDPTKFDLVLNLKAAKALGLEPPLTLLVRAKVIE